MSNEAEIARVVSDQFWHVQQSHQLDRRGWTQEQWVADAQRLLGDVDGSVMDLVNGHAMAMLTRITELEHRLFPSQGEGYANEVERQRVVIDGLQDVAKARGEKIAAALALHKPFEDEIIPWDCYNGDCAHDDWGECPPVKQRFCRECVRIAEECGYEAYLGASVFPCTTVKALGGVA